jgi:hypothetical protein
VRRRARTVLVAIAVLAVGSGGAAAPLVPVDGPIDVTTLLRLARQQAARNAQLYYEYQFRQTTLKEVLDARGDVKREETSVYLVIPTRDGTERHLLERDGRAPTAAEVRKQQKRNARVQAHFESMRRKSARRHAAKAAQAERVQGGGSLVARRPPTNRVRVVEPAPEVKREVAVPSGPSAPPGVAPGVPASSPVGQTGPGSTPPEPSTEDVASREGHFVVGTAPPAPVAPAEPPPPCSLDDPASRVRLPPGGIVKSAHSPVVTPASAEARQARKSAGDYSLFELLSLTEYGYAGTCELEGRTVHVVTFEPPKDFDALNPVERVVCAMKGTILVDAQELQVVRAAGRTVAPIKWGAGLVALRSAEVVLENAKVRDEVWLPSMDMFDFDARVVFDADHERVTHLFDDYVKREVTTSEEFGGAVEGR